MDRRVVFLAVTAATGTASATVITALDSGLVLARWFVAGVAYVALAVAGFVSLEVLKGASATVRHGAGITVPRIIAVVDVAVESVTAVVPGTGADEETAVEPIRAIVAVRGTAVGFVVEVSVGAYRSYTNVDRDLGGRH
jgi:hypothetical protein